MYFALQSSYIHSSGYFTVQYNEGFVFIIPLVFLILGHFEGDDV